MMLLQKVINFSLLCFCLIAGLLIPAACKKGNSTPPQILNATTADSAFKGVRIDAVFWPGNQFTLYGYASDNASALKLTFGQPFQLNQSFSTGATASYQQGQLPYLYSADSIAGGHTNITVTSWDSAHHHVAGNFSSVLYNGPNDSISITNGKFDVYCRPGQ